MKQEKYDVIIIGAGPGGYACAIRLGHFRKKVLLVEKAKIGGLCLNWGCIPTKALTYILETAAKVKHLKNAGLTFDNIKIDPGALRNWKDRIITKLTRGIEHLLRANGVNSIQAEAEILNPERVLIKKPSGEEIEIETNFIVIATGTEPSSLPNLQFDRKDIITTDEALELSAIPSNLLIIGAGASGLELGTVYARLGSNVTVVEIMEQILPGMDSEMANALYQILIKQGIKILLNSTIAEVVKREKLTVKIINKKDGSVTEDNFDKILLTVGRKPLTSVIEKINIKKNERGYIIVDQKLRTNLTNIFAIGDVTGPPLLAHKATKQGIMVAEIINDHNIEYRVRAMPSCIFTDPPLASVGQTEQELIKECINFKIGRFPFIASGKAVAMDETQGMVKIIGDASTGKLLGLHILGLEAPSLIGEGILAIEHGLKVNEIADAIHPHPTLSEAVMEAAENFLGKAIHIINR